MAATAQKSDSKQRSLRAVRAIACALIGLSVVVISGCTDSAGKIAADSVVSDGSGSPDSQTPTAPTLPLETAAADTEPPTTTTTTSTIPPTTIPHGDGVVANLISGEPIDEDAIATARSIYEAAIIHDYDRLRDIIGDRRFRWGFIGQRRPAEEWKRKFDEEGIDELARMAAVLEIAPGIDSRGQVVWPYLALKPAEEWTPEDEVVLTKLGFNPEDIASTKLKGRYVDLRLIIDATGIWNTFAVGY
jgi:hypothetical protein